MPKLMVKGDVIAAHDEVKSSGFFLDEDAIGFYEWHDWTAEKGLERLVFRVSRNPKYLKGHLERIYYCFENQLDLQLFGALADLVIVLGENGGPLCRRMINGSRSRLTQENYQALIAKIENKNSNPDEFLFNRYSVFTKGVLATPFLITSTAKDRYDHDPLSLAKSYIEVSQLDDAIEILEQAIQESPNRMELHDELMPLYRQTRNSIRFKKFFQELKRHNITLPPSWNELHEYFENP